MPMTFINEVVIIECNECGERINFYPHTVMVRPECDCGNKDSGRDWDNNDFGNFTLIYRGDEKLEIPSPWEASHE